MLLSTRVMLVPCLSLVLLVTISVTEKKFIGQPYSQEIDAWSICSDECGDGYQQKLLACFQNTLYIEENVPQDKCSNIFTKMPTIRKCNNGDCINGFLWKTSHWTSCSHSCGNLGTQTREVECYQSDGDAVDNEKCDINKKPETIRNCKRYNCPPRFMLGNWEVCMKKNPCSLGIQRRHTKCLSLQADGSVMKLPRAACSSRVSLSPISWRICHKRIAAINCSHNSQQFPEIMLNNDTVVQMIKVKKLHLRIGQIAYVILGTKLSLKCPVKYFKTSHLVWQHKNETFIYKNNMKSRLKVTKRGKMTIKSFKFQDQGEWICIAGNVKRRIILKLRSLSEGFEDWKIRNVLLNEDFSSILTKISVPIQDMARWITESWSSCSVSCEGHGIQVRKVQCERLFKKFYHRLEDNECLKQNLKMPINYKTCLESHKCPRWVLMNVNTNNCTDHCIDYERALVENDLKCMFREKTVDLRKCDPKDKPVLGCFNSKCLLMWKSSPWTKCSRSCGGEGIQARYLLCVWKNTGLPAGSFCYKQNLKIPQVSKVCFSPKCNAGCLDVFSTCPRKQMYCRLGKYKTGCCKTCENFLKSNKTDIKP